MEMGTGGPGTAQRHGDGAAVHEHAAVQIANPSLTRDKALELMDELRTKDFEFVRLLAPYDTDQGPETVGWSMETWKPGFTRDDMEKLIALAADFDCEYVILCGHTWPYAIDTPAASNEVLFRFS